MPEMDGFQLCYALKCDPALREIPFVFYTATYTDPEDEALGLSLGAEAYILKPADAQTLCGELEKVFVRGKAHGFKTVSALSSDDEVGFLKQYSARVVRKLEKKIQELRHSENWLKAVLTSTGDAVVATDEAGFIKFMNPMAEALWGWSAGEAIGKHISEGGVICNPDGTGVKERP